MGNIILYISYVGALYGLIKVIYDMLKRKKWLDVRKSHEFIILIVSISIAGCFVIPWGKIHFGDQPIKIVYRDTSLKKNPVIGKIDTHIAPSEKHKENSNIQLLNKATKTNRSIKEHKTDTVYKAKNLVTAPNYGNQQVGDNNVQNNAGKLDHHPEQSEINSMVYYLHDKTKTIVLAYETPDSDSANYCKELKSILEQYGYKVELFGHLNIGLPSQPMKIMVDTVNYRISVEWNYN